MVDKLPEMGGPSPSHSSGKEDEPWLGFRHRSESHWPPLVSVGMINYGDPLSSSRDELAPGAGGSALATDGPTMSTIGNHDPGIARSDESEVRRGYLTTNQSRGIDAFNTYQTDEMENLAASEVEAQMNFSRRPEETVQDIELSGKSFTELQKSPFAPMIALRSQHMQPTGKKIFRMIQIENDNQDLSFVEKVILSREEVFSLCNSIAAGSARATEGRSIIDFESLNPKSMKVVGFFGSKDVMREIFRNAKLTEQGDVWMQIQNDTLAPGLYAWLHGNSLFVFYWHRGHSLPEASRKDMSCNFIRYICDLCDTVCICLEGENLKAFLFERGPRPSKRQRTQRLQISLVKASEDSMKVTDGFVLQNLPLGGGHALPPTGRRQEKEPLQFTFGHEYKLSEGHSRIALLVASTRSRKLSSLKEQKKINVDGFPAFIHEWIVAKEYTLDLRNLSNEDFIVFIRSAKLKEADDYDRLLDSIGKRKEEVKKSIYTVDLLVEEQQKRLSGCLESFISDFLKFKYPWEESLMLLHSEHCFTSEEGTKGRSCELASSLNPDSSEVPSGVVDQLKLNGDTGEVKTVLHLDSPEILSGGPGRMKLCSLRVPEVTQDCLNMHESCIYSLLLSKESMQRFVFPNSSFYMFFPRSQRYCSSGGKRRIFTVSYAGNHENVSSKFAPMFYGRKVTFTCLDDLSLAPKTYTVVRNKPRDDYDGPMLTNEVVCISQSGWFESIALVPVHRTGDLTSWLNKQAARMEFPCLLNHAALLTAVSETLRGSEHEFDLCGSMARRILASENPLDVLQTFLPAPVLDFACRKWQALAALTEQTSVEGHQTAIAAGVKNHCVQMYKEFCTKFKSKICADIRRFTTSLLNQKIRKLCSKNMVALEATLDQEKVAFLASQKADLSRNGGEGSLTLTVEACKLIGRRSGYVWSQLTPWNNNDENVLITFSREELGKESITWHGLELAPMKDDLDRLSVDSEYAFSPSCSSSKEMIDLNPSSQTLSKVVFLKSGQLLVFVVEGDDDSKELKIYLCPKLGVKLSSASWIHKLKRGFDLVAYCERSRFIAFYDCSISTIKTYRFDETFRHMDLTGVDISLGEYSIGRLVWMDFVPDKNEIVFIDNFHRARLCEVNQPGMVRPGNVHMGRSPIVKACVSAQGSCLLVLRYVKSMEQVTRDSVGQEKFDHEAAFGGEPDSEATDNQIPSGSAHLSTDRIDTDGDLVSVESEEKRLMIEVYKLDDTLQHFTSVPLDLEIKDWSKLVVGLVSFLSQMHLVVFHCDLPSMLRSRIIKISLASEVCHLQQVTQPEEVADTQKDPGVTQSGPVLDYVYQIFEKYATSPPLSKKSRDLHLHIVLKSPAAAATSSSMSLRDKCMEYLIASLDRLKRDRGKNFSALDIHILVHDANIFEIYRDLAWRIDGWSRSACSAGLDVQMGTWIRQLLCLVPIQIARAEQNALKPMIDGLQLSGNEDYADAISLANVIRFGLYEAVFDSWTGPVKVVSSMGKQSSGKSYLLNHLSGSLLDVAGGRCTDGVWMTLCQGDGYLYILLDFEGLGSFERSEQEDMLLSMLNAAISNVTIFNKKDFHFDKETEAIFERFQNGVSLVKTDAKLFRGLFYMAIKDVDISDVEDLKKEFFSKISQICSKSQDNFLTRMYGGSVEISAMPSFNRPEFHDSIGDIARTVEEIEATYLSGRSFVLDLKLIIAQITTKDWSPIDSKRVALRINLLRKHLKSATRVGCLFIDGASKALTRFDDNVDVLDEPLTVDAINFPVCDTALELTAGQEKKVAGDILLSLMATFKSTVPRNGEKDEEWHSFFEKFLRALVLRRKKRVLQWISLNTSGISDDGDVQKLQLEAIALLADIQQDLLLCSCKCQRCFLRCLQEKGHPSNHSCMGDHRCVTMCTYCLEEESPLGAGPCNYVAGHDGPHDCHEKSHTCGKCCTYAGASSNCNEVCSKKSGHTGDHQCNSIQHTCNQVCSLPSCTNPCVSPIDVRDHEIHACHEKFCPHRCTMTACNRTCATEDHFHGAKPDVTHHFCGAEHPCSANCEHRGNCEVLTEVSKKTQTFTGKRATFDYVLVSEQNGNRKGCCIVIPPHKDRHDGPHSHSSNPDAVHFCETRCPSCGYFCNRPIEHGGLHSTTHGNMRDVNFVAESAEIDILDRKYAWGESGVAEMCQMHCKVQGRGHIHLIHCPAKKDGGPCRKLFDGARHEVRRYGPDFDIPKDEMTHAAYWEYVRFEDPCSAEEQKQFALCNHQCKSDEHTAASGGAATSAVRNVSCCTESLWHRPVKKTDLSKLQTGYITDDGHHFSCDHSTNLAVHVIFIIDRSTSMGFRDIRPSLKAISSRHQNRLGCVYEAILRFIRTRRSFVQGDIASVVLFNDTADTIIHIQEMKESLVNELLEYSTARSTVYSTGLQNAEKILSLAAKDTRLSCKSPVIIFLSDGVNRKADDPLYQIRQMKALNPKLQLHTIMFGKQPPPKILMDMAKAGDGTFEVSLNEVQLSRRFEGLAKSLRPQVASLL